LRICCMSFVLNRFFLLVRAFHDASSGSDAARQSSSYVNTELQGCHKRVKVFASGQLQWYCNSYSHSEALSVVVKALCYKLEGRGFETL
jgi:hypothetical protein